MKEYSLLKLKLKHAILYQAYVEVWFPIFFTWLLLKLSLLYLFLPVLIYVISPCFSTCTTTVLPTSMSETFPSSNGSNGNSLMESYLIVLTEIFLYPKLNSYLLLHFMFLYFITLFRLQSNTVHQCFLHSICHRILLIADFKESVKVNWVNRQTHGTSIGTATTWIDIYINTCICTHYILWYICLDMSNDGADSSRPFFILFHSRPL